ncbi:hypothetical protein ECG_00600 [Echinococcus granulosus]|uniref:Uncharacterized protein n=1 Tax=Echinococcus granulosus TaxID=6210 RepID=A0A068W932_ECHGR|nr:hypothetical protein ECG_00600 [Echinococcus granulosus]CDS16548.1 hypothetical protein EgrG_002020200 [Echinococcus granulosus]
MLEAIGCVRTTLGAELDHLNECLSASVLVSQRKHCDRRQICCVAWLAEHVSGHSSAVMLSSAPNTLVANATDA